MKIKYIIGDKYPEPEVHLCVKEKNREATEIYEAIEKLFELRIVCYRGQESELLSPTQIIRIYSENKKVYVRTAEDCYEVKDRLYVLERETEPEIAATPRINIDYAPEHRDKPWRFVDKNSGYLSVKLK